MEADARRLQTKEEELLKRKEALRNRLAQLRKERKDLRAAIEVNAGRGAPALTCFLTGGLGFLLFCSRGLDPGDCQFSKSMSLCVALPGGRAWLVGQGGPCVVIGAASAEAGHEPRLPSEAPAPFQPQVCRQRGLG